MRKLTTFKIFQDDTQDSKTSVCAKDYSTIGPDIYLNESWITFDLDEIKMVFGILE